MIQNVDRIQAYLKTLGLRHPEGLPDVGIEIPRSRVLDSLPSGSAASARLRILINDPIRAIVYRDGLQRAEAAQLRRQCGALRILNFLERCGAKVISNQ